MDLYDSGKDRILRRVLLSMPADANVYQICGDSVDPSIIIQFNTRSVPRTTCVLTEQSVHRSDVYDVDKAVAVDVAFHPYVKCSSLDNCWSDLDLIEPKT